MNSAGLESAFKVSMVLLHFNVMTPSNQQRAFCRLCLQLSRDHVSTSRDSQEANTTGRIEAFRPSFFFKFKRGLEMSAGLKHKRRIRTMLI